MRCIEPRGTHARIQRLLNVRGCIVLTENIYRVASASTRAAWNLSASATVECPINIESILNRRISMKHTRKLLLMSVAAGALIVGANAVLAQAPAPAPAAQAPAAQQGAPAEKIAPAMEPSKGKTPDAGMKSGQADDQKGVKAAQDNNKDGMKLKPTASDTKAPDAARTGKTSSDMKAGDKAKSDVKVDSKSSEKVGDVKSSDTKSSDSKSSAKPGDAKAATETKTEAKPDTTGQGAAAGSAKLSTEQRTTVRSAIQKQNARPLSNVNFSVSIGTRVPRDVRFYRVPTQLVAFYPSWRGYDYFLVGDQIVVVNPRTHQIVAVLDA
jgi:hypothetical protein